VIAVFAAVAAAGVVGLGLGRLLVGPGVWLVPDAGRRRTLLAAAWPLAASALAAVGAQQVLQLLLLRLHGAPEVGLLGGARKLVEAITLVPQALMLSVLPALSLAAATPAGATGAAREVTRALGIVLVLPATRAEAAPVLAAVVPPLALGAGVVAAAVALGASVPVGAALLLIAYPAALLVTGTVTRADLARWRA